MREMSYVVPTEIHHGKMNETNQQCPLNLKVFTNPARDHIQINQEKKDMIDKLFHSIPGKVSLEEMREERLAKYDG